MIRNYIQEKKQKHFTFEGIEIFIQAFPPKNISIKNILVKLRKQVPLNFIKNIDSIYVGNFKELYSRKIDAMYKHSSIFITNRQTTEDDILSDLVHEIAHSVEENYGFLIYGDGKIEEEFVRKRRKLWERLRQNNFSVDLKQFLNVKFTKEFDTFLYKEIGYPTLNVAGSDLFYSPYAATSLREYFANGFEAFFHYKDSNIIKKISPELYKKLEELIYVSQEE